MNHFEGIPNLWGIGNQKRHCVRVLQKHGLTHYDGDCIKPYFQYFICIDDLITDGKDRNKCNRSRRDYIVIILYH